MGIFTSYYRGPGLVGDRRRSLQTASTENFHGENYIVWTLRDAKDGPNLEHTSRAEAQSEKEQRHRGKIPQRWQNPETVTKLLRRSDSSCHCFQYCGIKRNKDVDLPLWRRPRSVWNSKASSVDAIHREFSLNKLREPTCSQFSGVLHWREISNGNRVLAFLRKCIVVTFNPSWLSRFCPVFIE